MRLDYLNTYNDYTLGPIQAEEALFLHGLSRMVRPQVVLEIGCLIGQSLRVWLESGVPFIYAMDAVISSEVKELRRANGSNRIELYEQDMKQPIEFTRGIPDLVFIDASHVLEDNQAAVKWILPHLKPGAIIAFHDTGHWANEHMTADRKHFIETFGGYQDKDGLWVHHPGEKETIELLSKTYYPKLQRLDLWTTATARYGITLFQVPNK